jgi:hypothetical protein
MNVNCINEIVKMNIIIEILLQVQFIMVFLHAFQLLFIDCDYPRAFVWWIGMHAVLFYYLFSDFYKQAYIKKSKVIFLLFHIFLENIHDRIKIYSVYGNINLNSCINLKSIYKCGYYS